MKIDAKLAIRVAIFAVGMVSTIIAASVQPVPAADGGPIPLCPPTVLTCPSMPPLHPKLS